MDMDFEKVKVDSLDELLNKNNKKDSLDVSFDNTDETLRENVEDGLVNEFEKKPHIVEDKYVFNIKLKNYLDYIFPFNFEDKGLDPSKIIIVGDVFNIPPAQAIQLGVYIKQNYGETGFKLQFVGAIVPHPIFMKGISKPRVIKEVLKDLRENIVSGDADGVVYVFRKLINSFDSFEYFVNFLFNVGGRELVDSIFTKRPISKNFIAKIFGGFSGKLYNVERTFVGDNPYVLNVYNPVKTQIVFRDGTEKNYYFERVLSKNLNAFTTKLEEGNSQNYENQIVSAEIYPNKEFVKHCLFSIIKNKKYIESVENITEEIFTIICEEELAYVMWFLLLCESTNAYHVITN